MNKEDDVDDVVINTSVLLENNDQTPRTMTSIDSVVYQKFNEYLEFKSDFDPKLKEQLRYCMLDLAVFVGVKNLIEDFKSTTTSTSSILVNGKKPRKDVVLLLAKIADELSIETNFPYLKNSQIKECINAVLGNPNERTFKKYYDIVLSYSTKDLKTVRIFVGHFHELMRPHILGTLQ